MSGRGLLLSRYEVSRYECRGIVLFRKCLTLSIPGRSAYFVNNQKIGTLYTGVLFKGTLKECDQHCINYPNCAMYNQNTADKMGYYSDHFDNGFKINDSLTERLIIRCNPKLSELFIRMSSCRMSPRTSTAEKTFRSSSTINLANNLIQSSTRAAV